MLMQFIYMNFLHNYYGFPIFWDNEIQEKARSQKSTNYFTKLPNLFSSSTETILSLFNKVGIFFNYFFQIQRNLKQDQIYFQGKN
jgi:hypothetical protein